MTEKRINKDIVMREPIIQSKEDREILDGYFPVSRSARDGLSILKTWFDHRNITKYVRSDAEQAWSVLAKITQDKSYEKLTRSDGRLLAQEMIRQGLTSKTTKKKIGHLRAAFNLAKQEGIIAINPFENVVPSIDDGLRRVPLDDDDMDRVRESFHLLREPDQHLWVWLAATGMRLDEPFHITNDQAEKGIRFVIVGKKTQSSLRRVPIPEAVLALVVDSIDKPLFEGSAETAGKRIRYFLRKLGISHDHANVTGNPSKVIHSLRHRAKDKLRAAGCPLEIQYELLGHEELTVASSYGRGHPMSALKKWIDEIGY